MNASIRSKVAALTVALVASAGFATSSMATASAESDGQRAVEVQTDGTVIEYVVTPADLAWRSAAPFATLTSASAGLVEVGTAGDTRYVVTDGEVIWGHAAPQATFALDRMPPATEVPADGGSVYVGMAGNIKYIVTSNEVIWGAISPGTAL